MSTTAIDNVALATRALSHLSIKPSERRLTDLQPFFDSLADDAVFKVACADEVPVYGGEIRGKKAIINLFAGADREAVADVEISGALEFYGNGHRVIVLGAQSYKIKQSGMVVRDKEFATVIDFRERKIVRVLSIEDVTEWVLACKRAADSSPAG